MNCRHPASGILQLPNLDDKCLCLQRAPNTVTATDQAGQLAQDVTQVIINSAGSLQYHSVKPCASMSMLSVPMLYERAESTSSLAATAKMCKTHDMSTCSLVRVLLNYAPG